MQPRVVSLLPSATEMVAALGYQRFLVGRSHECDFPPDLRELPVCSEPRMEFNGSSVEIDRQVKSAIHDAVSIYRVLESELQRLEPTVVITQTQCDVCAVDRNEVDLAIAAMVGTKPTVVSVQPQSLSDIWNDIALIAKTLGDADAGRILINAAKQRLQSVHDRYQTAKERPSIVCIEWLEPLMSGGNWLPELVEFAGGQALLATAGQHSPWMTWDDLIEADPDVIALMPCGFNMERTRSELYALTDEPRWRCLRAVQNGRVYLADGNQYFNRRGPRLVESAEILAELLHSPFKESGYQGTAWQRLLTN